MNEFIRSAAVYFIASQNDTHGKIVGKQIVIILVDYPTHFRIALESQLFNEMYENAHY